MGVSSPESCEFHSTLHSNVCLTLFCLYSVWQTFKLRCFFRCSYPLQLPVAEAMVTYKEEKSTGEESSQVFLPFLSDVRVGSDVTSGTTLASSLLRWVPLDFFFIKFRVVCHTTNRLHKV